MLKLVFPTKALMWNFIDSHKILPPYGYNNVTFTLTIADLDADQIKSAILSFDATVSKI